MELWNRVTTPSLDVFFLHNKKCIVTANRHQGRHCPVGREGAEA